MRYERFDTMRGRDFSLIVGIITAMIAICSITGCSSGQNDADTPPTPRPKAWPRINTYPEVYTTNNTLSIPLSVNSGTTTHSVNTGNANSEALDIVYPRYRATINLTLLKPRHGSDFALKKAIDSRLERINLNLGTSQASVVSQTNQNGINTLLVKSLSAIPTPLQILATDSSTFLLSATVFIPFRPSVGATDSLAPVIESLNKDLTHMLEQIGKP